MSNTAEPKPKQKTQPLAWLLAPVVVLIATIWSAVVAFQSDYPMATGDQRLIVRFFGGTIMSALLAAGAAWTFFYLAVFRRRASALVSIVLLVVAIVSACAVAIPAALVGNASRGEARRATIDTWVQQTIAENKSLEEETASKIRALGDTSVAGLRRKEDISTLLTRSQQELSLREDQHRQAIAIVQKARNSLPTLGLHAEEQASVLQQMEPAWAEYLKTIERHAQAAKLRTQIVTLLAESPANWTIESGRVAAEPGLLSKINQLGAEHDRIVAEINSFAKGTTPAGSAPPPRQ
jgi:hypothetical protein